MKLLILIIFSVFFLSQGATSAIGQGIPQTQMLIKKMPSNAYTLDGVIELSDKTHQNCTFILATPDRGTIILKGTMVTFNGLAKGNYILLVVSEKGQEELNFEL